MGQGKSQFTEEELQDYEVRPSLKEQERNLMISLTNLLPFCRISRTLRRKKYCSKYIMKFKY